MGSNHSKPCSGVPEREYRRAEQERIHQMYMTQQAWEASSDTAQAEVHVHCCVDDVDQYLEEANSASVMFHFKVVKSPEIKPDNSLEGGETPSLVEKPGAAEIASVVLAGAKAAESGGDTMVKSEPNGEVLVRSEPNGAIVVGTEAQPPTELDLPLVCLCDKVFRSLLIVEKSFRDYSEKTRGCSAGEDLSPSSMEPQLSMLSSDSQTLSPPVGAAESLNARDVHHPSEEALLANDQKAPCEIGLAMENAFDAAEELKTGRMQLDEAYSEETLEEVAEALSGTVSAEASDGCSGVKTHHGTAELSGILPSLGNDRPQVACEPRLILNETEEKMPEGYCDEGNMETQLEVLQERAQREMLATVDSEDETEWPIASKIFRTSELACWAHRRSSHTLCKKTNSDGLILVSDGVDLDDLNLVSDGVDFDDLILASDGVGLDDLQKDGAVPTPGAMKANERQTSMARNREALPPVDFAEMTTEVSSPKALLETGKTGQGGPLKEACPAEPIGPASRMEENHVGARLSPVTVHVSGTVLPDGASGQSC